MTVAAESDAGERQNSVRAVTRALALLSAMRAEPTGLRQLAAVADLPVPTAFRLLRTLEGSGFVCRTEDGQYVAGPAVIRLAISTMPEGEDRWAIHETVKKLCVQVNETVSFFVPDGPQRLCTEVAQPEREVRWSSKVGTHRPIYQGASGKVILAFGDSERLLARIPVEGGRYPLAGGRTRSFAQLQKEIAAVVQSGAAFSSEESASESRAVACPVFIRGAFIGALGVTVPVMRADEHTMAAIERACRAAAGAADPHGTAEKERGQEL